MPQPDQRVPENLTPQPVTYDLLSRPLDGLLGQAREITEIGFGALVTYSPKVFIPLTQLCRNVCHYCTFAKAPRSLCNPYLPIAEVVSIARTGTLNGCREALFTLGDKPELRYASARKALAGMGFCSTIDYLVEAAGAVLHETGLLPHINAGILGAHDIARLRRVSASMGLMLESCSNRLCQRGGVHYGSPDKVPSVRLETLRLMGQLMVPTTTGLLIGIGETREERIETLFAIKRLHEEHGHIQEVIVQNFRAKPGTRMADAPEPPVEDLLWTVAVARLILGGSISVQVPPNLNPDHLEAVLGAGINDWGGISPVTIDHVNPEAPWPQIASLAHRTASAGKSLVPRLTLYPRYLEQHKTWLDPTVAPPALRLADATGFAREDGWLAGLSKKVPFRAPAPVPFMRPSTMARAIDRAVSGRRLEIHEIATLFEARGSEVSHILTAADSMRAEIAGDRVTYVVNRNINYTNICVYRCQFCAFSKGRTAAHLRGKPYIIDTSEIARRAEEAWERGATEVCLQGGIHPDFTGATYEAIVAAIKSAVPSMHVHAFSPLEIWSGARTLGMPVSAYLERLIDAGLGSLPGTAAEVLDDDIRRIICPDKLTSGQWASVISAAHRLGLRTTATIMFGHVDGPMNWARHLDLIRSIQSETGGFTEFVPLPFVAQEAPMFLKGRSRNGPTFRECILMHAIARLVFGRLIPNIQVSWVKMGVSGAQFCLRAGANDLGGTLMNETITRSAGASHGQELPPSLMEAVIAEMERLASQRTTLYDDVLSERRRASFEARELRPIQFAQDGSDLIRGNAMAAVR